VHVDIAPMLASNVAVLLGFHKKRLARTNQIWQPGSLCCVFPSFSVSFVPADAMIEVASTKVDIARARSVTPQTASTKMSA